MKNILYIILIALSFIACNRTSDVKLTVENQPKIDTIIPKIKVVFVVSNPNIDVNSMNLDEITDRILNDSILQISSISKELYMKPQIIKVYKIEDITCPFLKRRFKDNKPGELVFEYSGKILIKLNDGVIKVYHTHEEK
jgi:hypothetical protein